MRLKQVLCNYVNNQNYSDFFVLMTFFIIFRLNLLVFIVVLIYLEFKVKEQLIFINLIEYQILTRKNLLEELHVIKANVKFSHFPKMILINYLETLLLKFTNTEYI